MEFSLKTPLELEKMLESMKSEKQFRKLEDRILSMLISKTKSVNRERIREQKNLDGSSFAQRKRKLTKPRKLLGKALREKNTHGKKAFRVSKTPHKATITIKPDFLKAHHKGHKDLPKRDVFGLSARDEKQIFLHISRNIDVWRALFG